MLFVPLPLFATLTLCFLFGRFVLSRDMGLRAHQIFAALLGLYALQSLLISLRWGYGIEATAPLIALLAPLLPALAYLSYSALVHQPKGRRLWPLAVSALNWVIFLIIPALADPLILLTYLGFGGLLLRLGHKGTDHLSLSPITDGRDILRAITLTGAVLIASALTDLYLVYDFIRNDGQSAPLVLGLMQTGFVLLIGGAALFARSTAQPDQAPDQPAARPGPTEQDSDIVARIETLFASEGLHRSEDLSLRRLSRRLGLSDRQVSNAINRLRSMSVSQFVNDARIREACELLAQTDKSVLDVSLMVGFASKSNFNRAFSRVTGTTPSQWRAQNQS